MPRHILSFWILKYRDIRPLINLRRANHKRWGLEKMELLLKCQVPQSKLSISLSLVVYN